MKIKPWFYGKIESGKLTWYNIVNFADYLSTLKDGDVQILIEPKRKIRTLKENSYYWGYVIEPLCNHLGYTPDEMHGIIKFLFKIRTTTTLSTVEFEELMSKIRTWASMELNCYIPEPNEHQKNLQDYYKF